MNGAGGHQGVKRCTSGRVASPASLGHRRRQRHFEDSPTADRREDAAAGRHVRRLPAVVASRPAAPAPYCAAAGARPWDLRLAMAVPTIVLISVVQPPLTGACGGEADRFARRLFVDKWCRFFIFRRAVRPRRRACAW